MVSEQTKRFTEETYAQLRLDGKTHDEAMAIIREAIAKAIPRAVSEFMAELRDGTPNGRSLNDD